MRNFINMVEMEGDTSHASQGQEIYFEQTRLSVGGLSVTLGADGVEIEGVMLPAGKVIELHQYLEAWLEDGYGSTVRSDQLKPRDPDAEPRYGEPEGNEAAIGSRNRREQ